MYKRCVVTVAVGKTLYLNLAETLLKSFLHWHKAVDDIQFLLLTDDVGYYSKFQSEFLHIKELILNENEKSFASKFKIFENIMADENIFIDCDCLIYKPLSSVFERFQGHDFSAIGRLIKTGDFFGDVATILKGFNLSSLPHFVGSVYYYKNNNNAKSVAAKALELKNNYDEMGLVRLRGKENEEPLIAIAMSLYGQLPIIDDGSIKADCMYLKNFKTNALTGVTELSYKPNMETPQFRPAIIHFNDKYSLSPDYLTNRYRLNVKYTSWATEIYTFTVYYIPPFFRDTIKDIFRPVYHKFLGPSQKKKNRRL